MAFREALAGAQIKRHIAPAPVVDIQLEGRIGFRGALFGDALFVKVARHIVVADPAPAILGAEGVGMDGVLGYRADGFEYFYLFVTDGFSVQVRRRFHGHQGEELEQMALDHIAQGPRSVVEFTPAFNAGNLSMRNLHMVDVVSVPQRLQQQVGKAEHKHILHGFLA